ncbi:MAG: DsrE family protein [Nitrospirae bacterium]|nr:DsrE family protein [Nitrospirota bacterium]MBF0533505.1 DsrE family protein [Nitrospirota bacterium]MBF0615971.1 DsrE family protein [Nitrospirota bacterium]
MSENADKKFVFIMTHSHDSVDAVAGAFQLAVNMRAYGTVVDFFLMDKAVLLAKEGFAETLIWQHKDQFSLISDLIKTLTDDFDAKFYICASCVKHYELDKAQLIKNSEIRPGSFLGEMLLIRQGLTF